MIIKGRGVFFRCGIGWHHLISDSMNTRIFEMLTLEKTQVWPLRASQMTGKHVGHPSYRCWQYNDPCSEVRVPSKFQGTICFLLRPSCSRLETFGFFWKPLIHWIMGYLTFFGNFPFLVYKKPWKPTFLHLKPGGTLFQRRWTQRTWKQITFTLPKTNIAPKNGGFQ